MAKKVSVFTKAKQIRKRGEDWQAAVKRATKMQKAPATKKKAAVSGTGKKKKGKKIVIRDSNVQISGTSMALGYIKDMNKDIDRLTKQIAAKGRGKAKTEQGLLAALKFGKTKMKKFL